MTRGIRTRLLLAFSWIGLFAVLAAGAAVYALFEVNQAMERITAQRVPGALASLELSRQAERIVAAAPKLLAVNDRERHDATTAAIHQQVRQMRASVLALAEVGIDATGTQGLLHSVDLLGANLFSLDDVVAAKIAALERSRARLNDLARVHIGFQRFLTPQVALMEARAQQLRNLQQQGSTDYAKLTQLAEDVAERLPMQNILRHVSTINETLQKTAVEQQANNLAVLSFPLLRAQKSLETTLNSLPAELREPLAALTQQLKPFVDGPQGLPELRRQELAIEADGLRLLEVNTNLTVDFTAAMNQLVDAAKADIDLATRNAASVQRLSTQFLLAMVALILLSSVLIVVLYVDRNLLSRLRRISDSMQAIAAGNLSTPVPATGRDEIGQMAAALEVFRQTALDVEASNLREIESARRRLTDAIESVSDGFSLFDADDRLVVANSRYLQMLQLDGSRSDYTFETILDHALGSGLFAKDIEDVAAWRAKRLELHRQPREDDIVNLADGRWVRVTKRRTEEGNTVSVYTDITELKQHELELAEAVRLKDHTLAELTIVLEAIDYGVLLLDADLRIRVANRQYRKIWNMPETFFARHPTLKEDMEYTRANGLYEVPDDRWREYIAERTEEIRGGDVPPRELLLADGTTLQYQCLALPDGGRMLTYFDITTLKSREQELAEAVRQKDSALGELKAVLDTIDYGVVFADADLRVRIANQAFREMWDIPESLTSQRPTIRELLDFHRGRGVHDVPDDEWEEYADRRLREIRDGHIPRSEMSTVSGKTFIYQCVALPAGVRMLTYFEITQLKRTEAALRESEERYSLAMRGANEGLWDWKADTDEIVVSPRFLEVMSLPSDRLNISLDDWHHILHEDDFASHYEALIAHLRGDREYYDTEFRVKRPDGSYRWVQNRGIGLRDGSGRVYRMAGSVSDIDARKHAEFALLEAKEKAEQASRVKSQFLANMSHELRTPLNAVIGITEMLREDAEDQGHQELFEPLERVSRAGKHLLNLINDILDISKIEAGRLELLLEHADLAGLLQDALNTAQPLAAQNKNELTLSLAPELGVVYVDPVRLRQIILNLISNACKFTKSGCVTLSARRIVCDERDTIEFSVADTGIGIAPEFLDSLFEEFTQVDASATRRYGGTGLGLAICRRLAQLMGGEIRVDSALGEGTTFTVQLPAEIQAPPKEVADVSLAH